MSRVSALLVVLAASSLAAAALAGGWLAGAQPMPLAAAEDALALLLIPPPAVAGLVLAAALLGAGSALLLLLPGVRGDLRLLVPAAAVQLLVFGLAVQGISTIALAGYLVALLLPLAGALLVVQVVRRYPRLRVAVALAVLAAVAWAAVTGTARPDALRRLAGNLAGGFATAGPELVVALLFSVLAAGWALLVLDAVRRTPLANRLTDAVVRHRRVVTVVAALGPVPYALARATWLTPWPQFGGPVEAMTPEIRLWGLLLGGAAALGGVLTLGLIRPWGEVFPRWMPGLAGRPVPVRAAAIPGGVVAAVLTTSAVPMVVAMLTSGLGPLDKALSMAVFPFGIWGPALALAVWGYAAAHFPRFVAKTHPGGPQEPVQPHSGDKSRRVGRHRGRMNR